MGPQITLMQMAVQAERAQLEARAARGWRAKAARTDRAARETAVSPIRHSLGAALVRVGEALSGRPHVAPRPTKAAA